MFGKHVPTTFFKHPKIKVCQMSMYMDLDFLKAHFQKPKEVLM